MSKRIKNAKLFLLTFVIVLTAGIFISCKVSLSRKDINNGVLSIYSQENENFNFGNKISLKNVDARDVIIGEELYILDENEELYNQIRTSSLLNKISRNSLTTMLKKEPDNSINHLYNGKSENLSAVSTYYNTVTEFEREFIAAKGYDAAKVKAVSNPFVVKEEGKVLYINDFVYFIDKTNNEVVDMVNINSKYNHEEDIILYMKAKRVSAGKLNSIKNTLSLAEQYYNNIYSKLPEMMNTLDSIEEINITSAKVYSKDSIIIMTNSNGEKCYLEVNLNDYSVKEIGV